MKKNIGSIDRRLRFVLAAIVLIMYVLGMLSGMVATVLLIFAAAFIVTGYLSWCPLYLPFGLSTRSAEDAK